MKYFVLLVLSILGITFWHSFRTPTAPSPSPEAQKNEVQKPAVTAAFLIYTNNIKRTFTAARYHNQSDKVYLTADNPQFVHVTVDDVTWGDFFATLPMKVTRECLTTGTGETYCTGTEGVLRFFINGEENPSALTEQIRSNDRLLVSYGLATELDISHQIQAVPYPAALDTPTPSVEE